jgi:hypothetical protein
MPDALYDTDFDAWAQAQASALRAKDWTALDIEHLAEEIEELRKSERYRASWQTTITYTRAFIERSLEDSPSLKPELFGLATEVYSWARQRAAKETRLPLATFPAEPPWRLEQLQDDEFLPGA